MRFFRRAARLEPTSPEPKVSPGPSRAPESAQEDVRGHDLAAILGPERAAEARLEMDRLTAEATAQGDSLLAASQPGVERLIAGADAAGAYLRKAQADERAHERVAQRRSGGTGGTVRRSEYLAADREAEALAPGPDGLPDAKLVRERDRLLVRTPLGWINPRSRTAGRYGLHSFNLRGTGYYEAAVRAGDFRPGRLLRLQREPENPHDRNAVAVYAVPGRNRSGYVPKSVAARLAPLMDSGVELVAVAVRGSGKGSDTVTPTVLVTTKALHERLSRGLG